MDLFQNENLSSSESTYSLFGPSKPNHQGLLMISPHVQIQHQPFSDSTNLIKPPTRSNQLSNNGTDRKKLFVGNLPSNTTLDQLIELFSKYGKVNRNLSVVKDDNYAFIHFYSEVDAELAHKELNDSFFKNRYIRVQYSVSQGHIKKSRTVDFTKAQSQLISASSSYSSINSNDNQVHKLSQSQSVMTFANINNSSDFNRQIGRPIKKTAYKSMGSSINLPSFPQSHSFDEIGILANMNQVNYTNYIYLKSLLEQRSQLQQIEEFKLNSTAANLLSSISSLNLNQI
ncbi:unnamed protein product [Brachionus calyciflorus]|uniref:RRM domain-containing protein n=1 Tax=Brachionus calyciflorus TaxID=104777 RepID=A0A813VQR4_9BILA|nr:unnamed protein product [Brachionus calyciflorus]